jgi:methionine synthase I (cobalamin-dependent)
VDRPADVEAIHRAYRDAGCELITTNTFGGCSATLNRHGLADRVAELNRAGAQAVRRAVGDAAWVVGDIGPFGDFLAPWGDTSPGELLVIFRQQVEALCEGGCDAFIIETMSDPAEVAVAVQAAKEAGDRPVIATYAFTDGGNKSFRTMVGNDVKDAIARAVEAGADVVGANCGSSLGLDDYVNLAEQIVAAAQGRPVIVQPNAGSPTLVDGKLIYKARPEDMAAAVPRLLKTGVRIIGGCCGTTPKHLQAMGDAIRRATPG